MFTLIKREIETHILFLFAAVVIVSIYVTVIALSVMAKSTTNMPPVGVPPVMFNVFWLLLPTMAFGSTALGATQMYSDRNGNISAFLSTLTTTRRQILTAKLIVGISWILIILGAIIAADAVLMLAFPRLVPTDITFLSKLFASTFLCSLACYALGLQTGWNTNKYFPILAGVAATPVMTMVIVIKGFGFASTLILLLLGVTMVLRVWQRFMSTAL